ncbi:MAG: response regulator [Gammaproteobacteria bacterium]|nr:response regulator [Gammaproteobacteria bacterium]
MHEIMIVDDEENILKAIKRIISQSKKWNVETYTNAEEALQRILVKKFDLYLSDYKMPNIDGISFLTAVKSIQPDSIRLILSGYTDLDALMGAINQAEIFRFITKPWNDDYLIGSIEQALGYRDVLIENQRLADQVRKQQETLDKQKKIFEEYTQKHPEIFNVEWEDDGSISIIDE